MTELLLDWFNPFITRIERDRIVAWHLGVSLYYPDLAVLLRTCDQNHSHH